MKINIRSFAMIREAMGSRRVQVSIDDNASLKDVLSKFMEDYPLTRQFIENRRSEDTLEPHLNIVLNSKNIPEERLGQIKPKDGDEVVIVPPTGGGSWLKLIET